MLFQRHAWLQQCQAVIPPIPVALGKLGQEQEESFVPGSAHSSAQGEGEATDKTLYPRSLKERTAQVFYYQDQQPFLVLVFYHSSFFFFPFFQWWHLLFPSHPSRLFGQSNAQDWLNVLK